MPDLQKILLKNLSGARRIALLAVGSELRSDDAAGLLVAARVRRTLRGRSTPRFRIFIGETAPENQTGAIRKFSPSHLVVIDSADAGKRPGTVFAIDPGEVGGISFSTHQLPLRLMIEYLRETITCSVAIIGIQPKSLAFGGPVSRDVDRAVDGVAADLVRSVETVLKVPGKPAPRRRKAPRAGARTSTAGKRRPNSRGSSRPRR